jgi:hypothetical protein
LLIYGRGGALLKPLWTLPLDGVAHAHYLNEETGVLFVGTNLGTVVALRRLEDWKMIESLTTEPQGEAALVGSLLFVDAICLAGSLMAKDAPVTVLDGDRLRLDFVNRRFGRDPKAQIKFILEKLNWL